jgi:hypothetical protein
VKAAFGYLTKMTVPSLVDRFRSAAIAKGDFASRAHDAEFHKQMSDAYRLLVAEGDHGQAAFTELLSDSSPHVRSWVAAQLLFTGNVLARPVLETLAAQAGLVGLSARVVLREYDMGRLGSPL